MCPTKKARYETEEGAARSLEAVRERRSEQPDSRPPELRAYRCGYCKGWHLTSRPLRPPKPGTFAARPWFGGTPELAGKLTREDKLERKLANVRWQRDRWQRRHGEAVKRLRALEERRGWVEQYVGFRVEYRLRGWWRRLKRHYRIMQKKLRP